MAAEFQRKDQGEETARRIRSILATRGLTLHKVSQASESLYGSGTDACIPHTLYHSLEKSPEFGPSLAQVCALSRISGYSLLDWLVALGIDLETIAGLQASLPRRGTVLIDPDLDRTDLWLPGLIDRKDAGTSWGVVPLDRLCMITGPALLRSIRQSDGRRCLFAKIGVEDAFAFPELLPGSIVRVIRNPDPQVLSRSESPMLLIESSRGFWCGRFPRPGEGTVYVFSRELPFAPFMLRIPSEARILGVVDMEIRWTASFQRPCVPPEFAKARIPGELAEAERNVSGLIRRARIRSGLTLQDASLLTRRISAALDDERYLIAQSTLSDYEARSALPRRLQKLLTVCLVYGIRLAELLASVGIPPDQIGHETIPLDLLPPSQRSRQMPANPLDKSSAAPPSRLLREFGEVPWFLRSCLNELSGIPHPCLRDFFCFSSNIPSLPWYCTGALIALVNRRKRKVVRNLDLPAWHQPLWMLRLDSGTYKCGRGNVEDGLLVLDGPARDDKETGRLRVGRDVDVIGQVVAIARRIA
jgi:transcriptional regulator with XRE-family HTH domain